MNSEYKYLESLNDEDILEFKKGSIVDIVKVKILKTALKTILENNLDNIIVSIVKNVFRNYLHITKESISDLDLNIINGINCKILKANEEWKNGEIKIVPLNINVEFLFGVVTEHKKKYLEFIIDNDAIIEFTPGILFKVETIKNGLRTYFEQYINHDISSIINKELCYLIRKEKGLTPIVPLDNPFLCNYWVRDGIICKLLQVNKNWISGIIKITIDINIEFFPKDL